MATEQTRASQPLFFQVGVDLGKLCYEQTISTWVVKSDLLIGVKLDGRQESRNKKTTL